MPGENLGTTTIPIPLQKIKAYKPTSTTQAVPETYAGPQSRYDDNYFIDQSKMDSEFFQSMRAENQGFGMEIATAAANLIPNIALSIAETTGYLFDLEDWSNMIQNNKADYGNALTRWASENKNQFGEVYTKSTDGGFDMSDSAWWVSNGAGLVESLVAYGLVGYGTGAAFMKGASGLTKALGAYGKTKMAIEGAAQLGTSLTMAYSEGAMTGAQVFKDVYADTYNFEYEKNINAGMGDNEAKARAHYTATDIAGEGATKAVRINTGINTFLNLPETGVLFRSMGASRYMDDALKLQKGEFAKDAVERLKTFDVDKHLTRQGIKHWGKETGSEMLEEMVNVYAEEEGKNVGRLATGQDITTLGDMLANDDIWAAGFWGAVGGSMNGFVMSKMPKWVTQEDGTKKRTTVGAYSKDQVKTKYEEQLTDLQDRLTEFVDARDNLDRAAKSGDEKAHKEAADKVFSYNSFNSIVKGTEEQLLNDFEQIAAFTPEQAAQQGFASDYKERATEKIQSVRENTKEWNKIQDRHASQDLDQAGFPETIFQQHMNVQNNRKIIQENTLELAKLESEISQINTLRGTDLTATSFNNVISSIKATEHALEMATIDLDNILNLDQFDNKTQKRIVAKLSNTYGNIANARQEIEKHLNEIKEKREDLINDLEIQKANFYSFVDPDNTMTDQEKETKYANTIAQNSADINALTEGKKTLESNRKILVSQTEELRVLKSDKGLERFKALKKEKMAEREALDAAAAAKAKAEAEAKAKAAKVEEIKTKKKEAPETVTVQEEEIIEAATPVVSYEEGAYSGEGSSVDELGKQYDIIIETADNSNEDGVVNDSSNNLVSINNRLISGANKLAYASTVQYTEDADGIEHISLKLNPETNPNLLTDAYVPGTKLKIKRLTAEEFKPFIAADDIKFIDELGREITVANLGQVVTFAMLSHPYMQPIGIYNEAGEYQAMLHAVNYITDKRIVAQKVAEDLQTLINIRAAVTDKFQDITLDSKSNGKLNQLTQFYRLSELIDEPVEFAIATSSIQLNTNKVTPVENLANKKGFKVGQVYAITVMPDGRKLAVPVKTTKVKETPEVVTELMNALNVFLKDGSRGDLQTVFNKYLFSVFSSDKLTSDGNSFQESPNDVDRFYVDFTSSNTNGIIFGRSGGAKNFISGNTPADDLEVFKKLLTTIIEESYININFESLKDSEFVKKFVTSNVRFYPLPNGKVTVFDNPVLGFDTSTLLNATAPAAKVTPTPVVPISVLAVTPTTQVQTIEEIKNDIAQYRAAEQAEYAAMPDPNDTVEKDRIYGVYNKLITPLINKAEADIEKRKQEDLKKVNKKWKNTKVIKTIPSPFFKGFSAADINNFIGTKLKNGDEILVAYNDKRAGKDAGATTNSNFIIKNNKLVEIGNPGFDINSDKRKFEEIKVVEIEYEEDAEQKNKINAKYKAELDAVKQVKPATTPISDIEAKKADIEKRRQEELDNVGAKQKKAGFLKLREAKTSEEQLNAINEIERNVLEGAVLTKEEQKEIQKIKDNLSANGYEVPELLGKQFHQGMKVIVTSSIPDNTDTLAEGEEIITKVLKPQINKDDKMVQTAQIEVTVGTKKGGLTKEQWLEEQNKKEKRTDKINAVYDAELAALEQPTSTDVDVKKADIERRRQESLNAIKQRPNETLFTAPYYKEGYNFKQLPTDSAMRTEAEEKEYYEILTNNNTLTDVSIQVKTKEEAEKLINAKYNAELTSLESKQPTLTNTTQPEISLTQEIENAILANNSKEAIENRIVITGTDGGFRSVNTSNTKNEKSGTTADVRRSYSDDKYEIEYGEGDDKKSIFSDINIGEKKSYHYFVTDKKTKKRYYVVGISSRVTGNDPERNGSLFATIEDDGNITDFTRTVLELALIKEFENQTKKRKNIFRPLPQEFIDKVKAAELAALKQPQPTPVVETAPVVEPTTIKTKESILNKKEEKLANVKPVYHHTSVDPKDFNFNEFQRGNKQVSQFGDGLNASSNTTSFLVNRYGKAIQGEINNSDFVKIDASKTEKEVYEELKNQGYRFSEEHNTNDILAEVPGAAMDLFTDFQKSNPDVKGVQVNNHIIGDTKVAPFYVIYDAKSFYGQGSLTTKIEEEANAELAALSEIQPTPPVKIESANGATVTIRLDEDDDYSVTTTEELSVKPGVQELFDSNPEIANAVYEALGFKERNQVGENPFNTVVNFDLNKIRSVSGKLGEQGATPDGIRNLLKYVGVDLTNVDTDSTKAMADYLRSNPSERNKVLELVKQEPIKLSQLPDGSYDLKDGNHRSTILYYSGIESIPAIITNNTGVVKTTEEYTGPFGGVSPVQEIVTPQQKQQALQLYSQYLDSVFPDSQVKDIVYHGSSYGFEGENFDTSIMTNGRTQGDGVYFSTDRKAAERFADISESMYEMFTAQEMQKYLKVAVVNAEKVINGNEVIVQPEQIHILGSKQDIDKFKEFAKSGKQIEKSVSLQDKVNTLIEEGKATKFCK